MKYLLLQKKFIKILIIINNSSSHYHNNQIFKIKIETIIRRIKQNNYKKCKITLKELYNLRMWEKIKVKFIHPKLILGLVFKNFNKKKEMN